jgi:hypothetical protein
MARAIAGVFVLLCLAPAPALSQSVGAIVGRVADAETKEPVAYANVIVVGTHLGAMSLTDGTFRIPGLVPGHYEVIVLMMGYDKVARRVQVRAGEEVRAEFAIQRGVAVELPPIVSHGDRIQNDVTDSQQYQGKASKEMKDLPLDNVGDVLGLFSGVVDMGGQQLNVSLFSTQAIEFISGGMDAEYGDAQSAIVNLTTREGGSRFGGELRYWTDDFGRKDKSYTNYDRVSLGMGGPAWSPDVRFYLSGEATLSDNENTSDEPRREHKITEWLKFRERMTHSYSLQSKVTYKRGGAKFTGEVIAAHSSHRAYLHNWNVKGYVRKVYYFQGLRLLSPATHDQPATYGFGEVAVIPHGEWAEQRERLTPRAVTVRDRVRDPETGVSEPVMYYHFRAVDIDGRTVLWDEVVRDGDGRIVGTRPWILFEGFQQPYSDFSYFKADTSFVPFNSAQRTPTLTSDQLHTKLSLAHAVSARTLYRLDFSRLELRSGQKVGGKSPEQYETAGQPVTLPDGTYLPGGLTGQTWYTDADHPYFVTAYDFPYFAEQTTVQYVAQASITSERLKGHRIKSGLQFVYNDLDGDQRVSPGLQRVDRVAGTVQQGLNTNLFHNFNTEGAFYVQDKWQHEGMVVNGGLRLDYFSTGNNDEIRIRSSEVDPAVDRYKLALSPRLGLAFPITDRDKFFFHYGRFTQWPSRVHMFSTQDPIGPIGTLGNPNLDFELTVSYQAGISHYFSDDLTGNFVVFNKDIYGLVTSAPVTDDTLGLQRLRFVNRAYASARGLEVALEKRLTRHFGFDVAYTYSFADGVASNADFGRSAEGLTHLPTDELPLDWDQRHTLSVSARIRGTRNWLVAGSYFYGSGLPWTPVDRFARLADPTWENARRLQPAHLLNIRGQKRFNVRGRDLVFLFEGRNLLDEDVLLRHGTGPSVTPAMESAEMDGGAYLTETGRYGGAYLQDVDADGVNDFVPVHDPSVWRPHRVWRVGIGFEF